MTNFSMPPLLKSAVVAGALLSLGGCMYGTGYYGDGYVNNSGYACDPYAPFDDYYACDYGYGFANIGFGGGWYDQFYYPGYGVYIFDRGGHRHAMRDNHRRHWARQRAEYGGHHFRERNGTGDRHAERHGQRHDEGDGTQYQRHNGDHRTVGVRSGRGDHQATTTVRTGDNGQAIPVRDRSVRAERRPTMAVEQPQVRSQPAARPAVTPTPARAKSPRHSRRTSHNGTDLLNDD